MAVYFVTGKLGSGKTLVAVGRIRDVLSRGGKVATNLDLRLEKLVNAQNKKAHVVRLPDKPRVEDLDGLGLGCDRLDERKYGLIVLDELGTWFNSRNWQDKERMALIDWFLHSRKKRWDVFFIVQDIEVVDKQLRQTLAEHTVNCKRLDRFAVPIIGWVLRPLGINLKLPKVHLALVFYGPAVAGFVTERWVYHGRSLYGAYDTEQVFKDEWLWRDERAMDMRAAFQYLPPWYTVGRYQRRAKWGEYLGLGLP